MPEEEIVWVIEQEEPRWVVSCQHSPTGHFKDRTSAMHAAVEDARRLQQQGHRVTVRVRRADGSLRDLPPDFIEP